MGGGTCAFEIGLPPCALLVEEDEYGINSLLDKLLSLISVL